MSKNSRGYKLPSQLTGHGEKCLKMKVPDDPIYLAAIVGAIQDLCMWYNWEKTGDTSGSIAANYWRDFFQTLTIDSSCGKLPPVRKKTPEGVTFNGDDMHICVEDYMGNIYINNCGCGCGCGGAQGDGSTVTSGGAQGDGSFDIGASLGVTKCDIATSVLPYYLAQASEWFTALKAHVDAGGQVIDFIEIPTDIVDATDISPNLLKTLSEIAQGVSGGLAQIISMLGDTDFIRSFRLSWWRATSEDNALTGKVLRLSRADLKRGNRYIPLQWGSLVDGFIVLPRVLLDFFVQIVNMDKINWELVAAEGSRNEALCALLAAENGESYESPTGNYNPENEIYEYQANGYAYTARVFRSDVAFSRFTQNPFTLPVDATGFDVVGAGIVLNDINNLYGNSPEPQMRYNSQTGILISGSEDLQNESSWHLAGWNDSKITTGGIAEIENWVITRVGGYEIDEYYNVPNATINDSDILVGAQDIDGGSATLAYCWLVTRVAL